MSAFLLTDAAQAGFDLGKLVRKANGGNVAGAYAELSEYLETQSRNNKESVIRVPQALAQQNSERHLHYFALGEWAMQLKKWSDARTHFAEALKYGHTNDSHIQYLIGHSFKEEKEFQKAMQAFNKVFDLKPPQNISYDTRKELSEIAVELGQLWRARSHLQTLERRWRGTPNYPEVVWQLMELEFKDNRRHLGCKWARKLYSRYPASPKISHWSVDLQANKMGDKTIGCFATLKETKERIRNLRLSGMADQARKEIDLIKSRARPDERVQADMLLADHLENQGYPDDALKLLTPHYEARKNDLNFLSLFGKIAARAGEYQIAIGAFTNVNKASPRSRMGRNALFTAAYLSYQIQDYDGAFRKFSSINEKYQGSSLARDARWHLAWLQYLKGNYATAERAYTQLLNETIYKRRRRVVRPFQDDRTKYWLALSMLKQEKYKEAAKLLTPLANDKSFSFYSILAHTRLKQMPAGSLLSEARNVAAAKEKVKPSGTETEVSAAEESTDEFILPRPPLLFAPNGQSETVTEDSEENLQLTDVSEEEDREEQDSKADDETKNDLGPKIEAADANTVSPADAVAETNEVTAPEIGQQEDDEKIVATTVSDPRLRERFQAANNLMTLGQNDWAKWELYEIERRTSNKTYLKMLMEAYAKLGYYNRSAYISEIYFSRERQNLGLQAGRELWQYNFPKAYEESIEKYTKKFNVSESLVLAIMRAESHFNKDALSPVGARGLMQIMPYTATHVARLLGEEMLDDKSLFLPETNIKLGSRYLSRLQKKFQDQVPLVAAGYNAGPHRVSSWLSTFGNLDMDEFIEHVPFVETRNYMKKVVRNFAIYNALYDNEPTEYKWLTEPVPVKVAERPSPRENWETSD